MGIKSNNPLEPYFNFFGSSGVDALAGTPSGPGFSASGGNVDGAEPGNGYAYHIFTSPGTFVASGSDTIEFLVVGGGGGGGQWRGSGGGAGGVTSNVSGFPKSDAIASYSVSPGTYPVTIGPGGAGGSGDGTAGTNTVFNGPGVNSGSPITAPGGGYGAGCPNNGCPHVSGGPGGSGGGGRDNTSSPGTGSGGSSNAPTSVAGNTGGSTTQAYTGAGGGGAGGQGYGFPDPNQGDGGPGVAVPGFAGPLFPTMPAAWISATGPTGLFGGGGAGHEYPGDPHSGGPGGGGDSGSSGAGEGGVDYTGGGGGGGADSSNGGEGGDGIVIIRYAV
jgi:hypothetical protein